MFAEMPIGAGLLIHIRHNITEPGQYRTRCGEIVTIDSIGKQFYFRCSGRYSNGIRERWSASGRIFSGMLSDNDIVAKV